MMRYFQTHKRRAATRLFFSLIATSSALTVLSAPAWAQSSYSNIVNDKFATISSGPQDAILVDVPSGTGEIAMRDAVVKKLKANWRLQAQALSRSAATLERGGIFKNGRGVIPVSTLVRVRENGVPLTRARKPGIVTRAVGGGTLTFRYTGWSAQDRTLIQQLIAEFYPRIEAIYGKPAVSSEVEIFNLGTLDANQGTQIQRLAFGGYDADNNRIMLPIYESDETFAQALLLNLVHAFHGPAVFEYDAWEQGFARAAASVVARSTFSDNSTFSDGSANNLYSLLSWYDLLNQPGLGNPTFFPPSQKDINLETTAGGFTLGKMTFPRMGMSGAAWLKVYIENSNFFRLFNEAYYAQFDANASPSLAGNVPALKNIAAPLLPGGVEGMDFNEWFRRQYILDSSVSVGRKLYAFVVPGAATETKGQSHLVQVMYYRTKPQGDEDLINGTVYATYHDSSGARLNLGIASEQVSLQDGEGSITTQSFQKDGRLTLDFAVGAETARTYVPGGLTGDLQAVVLGANSSGRDIAVSQQTSTASRTQTTKTENGAFAVNLGTAQNDLAKTVIEYTDPTGTKKNFRRNTGDGSAYLVLAPDQFGGDVTLLSHDFEIGQVPSLVSFPLRPLSTNISEALGLNTSDFLLTYWDPVSSQYATALADPNQSIQAIAPGRGYWFKLQPQDRSRSTITVQLSGVPPVTDTDFAVTTRYGWNMIGSPFASNVTTVRDILVQYLQNDAYSWDEAVARNLVAEKPYRYDRTNGQFVETDTIDATQWQGVYLRVLVPAGVTLLLPAPDATTRAVPLRTRSQKATTAQPDWRVTLRATQEPDQTTGWFARETTASFGAARGASDGYDNAYDREAPPAITSGVGLAFDAPTKGSVKASGGRFVSDFREASHRGTQWHITSLAAAPGQVHLSWENLGTLPRTTRLMLTDDETGEKTALRSRSSLTWTATDTKRTRRYTITAEQARTTPLMLTNLQITRMSGRSIDGTHNYSISYTVTNDAQVSIELQSLSGKVVRRLDGGGRSVQAGVQKSIWNGRAEDGSSLPAGTYTMRITARVNDGEGNSTPVTVIRPVLVLN